MEREGNLAQSFGIEFERAVLATRALWGQIDSAGPETAATASSTGWMEVIFSGGPIGIAIVVLLIALSLISVYLVFDQILTLRRSELIPDGLGDEVRQGLLDGKLEEASEACRQKPSLLAFVLLNGISELPYGWTSVEKALEDALAEQSARLYRKAEYLSVIGNIAPMVGLLGTVFGMILAFQRVAESQGTASASDLAEGIYQALVTTVGGLVVAIPSLGAFAVLRNRLDQLVAEAANVAQHVFAPLRKKRATTEKPSR
jgi:biopolymer transport protein ExbB